VEPEMENLYLNILGRQVARTSLGEYVKCRVWRNWKRKISGKTPSSSTTQTTRALVVEPTYSDAHCSQRCLCITNNVIPSRSLSMKLKIELKRKTFLITNIVKPPIWLRCKKKEILLCVTFFWHSVQKNERISFHSIKIFS
jgi:hypothetical protein